VWGEVFQGGATLSQREATVQTADETQDVPICENEGCDNPSPRGRFCPPCFQRWQEEHPREQRLAEWETICAGVIPDDTPDGTPCKWVVKKRSDGHPALCDRCNSRRLIVSADRVLENFKIKVPEELQEKLTEAEEHFRSGLRGAFRRALGAAREFFALKAKGDADAALAKINDVSSLCPQAHEEYDKATLAWEHGHYFDARDAAFAIHNIQDLKRVLDGVDEEGLNPLAAAAYAEAVSAFEAGSIEVAWRSVATMRNAGRYSNELSMAKRQGPSDTGKRGRKDRRREHDRNWRRRFDREEQA